jgi:hypothetical protein
LRLPFYSVLGQLKLLAAFAGATRERLRLVAGRPRRGFALLPSLRSVLLIDYALLHHEADMLKHAHVRQRVATHGDQVGELSLFYRS